MADRKYPDSGILFTNDRKQSGNSPDFNGKGEYKGVEFSVSGWTKKGRSGKIFISLSFKPPYQPKDRQPPITEEDEDTQW